MPPASARAAETLKLLSWQVLPNHIWKTSFGQVRVGWISDAALTKLVRLSWGRMLYNIDTKTLDKLPTHLGPHHGFHHDLVKEGGERYRLTVLMAAASDGRLLDRLGSPKICPCGEACPDRLHLTFHCSAQTGSRPIMKTLSQCRLLLPLIPLLTL